ncbi:T9SS type A sorting domain-containing protein [Rhodocytophaga aerolata]|uniref:T9SS type A sorting domain-containing protein n=1 Tax=Rhodocytophaga aerolata TaxID=455078 RepID=A0ABT8R2T7_9BACT|nr:T9SS type A sorting domain-containing protein [Rhodocytophaga aerolata]MDO1446403.1 T9SS type A sorting domain-containing protein [Rhodocytophaga aerolata]
MSNKSTLFSHVWLLCAIGAFFLISPIKTKAAVIYVNGAAAGANTGTSWINAFTSLQSALAASEAGDQIWVAKGVYKPSLAVDIDGNGLSEEREATFQIKSGVKVYGGFAGGEATLTKRNWIVNPTILSGDIDNNDANADANFIAETTDQLMGNNAYHVIYTVNVDKSTVLDGFTITAGKAYAIGLPVESLHIRGGGWFNKMAAPLNSSSPSIANCVFQGNYAEREGGAWYTSGTAGVKSEAIFKDSKFIQNKSNRSGGAIYIGSFTKGSYKPQIINCQFVGNRTLKTGGAIFILGDTARIDSSSFINNAVTIITNVSDNGSGGAVYMFNSKASFYRTMFSNNKATGNANGPYENGGGGAVYMYSTKSGTEALGEANIKFVSCGFYNNITSDNPGAWGGAGLHINDEGKMNVSYKNCVFSGNHAQTDGGAVANYARQMNNGLPFTPFLRTNFTNCTFSNNTAGKNGGALYYDRIDLNAHEHTSLIENSILYGNTAGTSGPQVKFSGGGFFGPTIAYSLIEGGYNATVGINGGNNISGDPQFINAADVDGGDDIAGNSDDGLRVSNTSPVINAGNSAADSIVGITKDFAGEARVQGSNIDMGAYERASGFIPPSVKYFKLKEWKRPRPGCLSCPWAIRLQDKAIIFAHPKQAKGFLQNFEWKSDALLAVYADSAIVRGRIASQANPSIQFEVYLKLVKPSNWAAWAAQNRTYSALTPEAKKVAAQNYQQWTYWELSSQSRLIGRAAIEGTLKLSHAPITKTTGFQLGLGANDQDGDFGLNGEFVYAGVLSYRKNKQKVNGIGSLNADAFVCKEDCEFEIDSKAIAKYDFSDSESKQPYQVYPNPVHDKLTVEMEDTQEGMYTFTLYDLKGQRVQQVNAQLRKNYVSISTQSISPGIYRLEIRSPDGSLQYSKIARY